MNSIFKGIYPDHEEAENYSRIVNGDAKYPQEIWKARQLSFLELASTGKVAREEVLSKILRDSGLRNVVDFGGGCGWIFKALEMNGLELAEKTIIETAETIDWFSMINPNLVWQKYDEVDLRDINTDRAVLYSNSCIQYIPDAYEYLQKLISYDWPYLIFEDIPNVDGNDFWTLQQYYGYSSPYHFFNLNELSIFISSNGYQLVNKFNYSDSFPENWCYQIEHEERTFVPNSPVTLIYQRI